MSLVDLRKAGQRGLTLRAGSALTCFSISPCPNVGFGEEQHIQRDAFQNLPGSAVRATALLVESTHSSRHMPSNRTLLQPTQAPEASRLTSSITSKSVPRSASGLFSPDKLAVCPGWHLHVDQENQPSLVRFAAAVSEYGDVFYLFKMFFRVFYICLAVSSDFSQ